MSSSRLQKSIKNLLSGFLSRIVILLLGIVVRTVFIKILGNEYLSVNGLYTNILNMLSLAELGFGTAMVYNMYKPLAENDEEKLASLMLLYKKVYRVIGFVILGLGLSVIPFMDYIIKDPPNISHLTFYYLLFLFNSVTSYWFFAFKRSIVVADQKEYVCNNFRNIVTVIKTAVQIVFLLIFKNFTVYLLIQLGFTLVENFLIATYSNKKYSFLNKKDIKPLDAQEKQKIWKNVKALIFSQISYVMLTSTDNIIISAFVGISWVGLLSNFTLIVEAITGVLCQVTQALSASLGNFFAKEDKQAGHELFKKIDFLNFWLYGFSTIALITLLNPFITIWLGKEFTIPLITVIAISLNFFIAGFMNTLWTFRSTLGLFTQGQYRPIIVALLNIGLSIALSYVFGVTGVLFATAISRACVNLWYDPWVIHKKGFGVSVKKFSITYLQRGILLVAVTIAMVLLANFVVFADGITIVSFIVMVALTAIIPNAIFFICFSRKNEFKYYINTIKSFKRG